MAKVDVNPKLRTAYEFFLKHSGHVKGKREQIALDLARAEALMKELGWECEWEQDDQPYEHGDAEDPDYEPQEVLGCVLRDADGEVLESLWGIADPDKIFARVTEAELADEALYEKGLL